MNWVLSWIGIFITLALFIIGGWYVVMTINKNYPPVEFIVFDKNTLKKKKYRLAGTIPTWNNITKLLHKQVKPLGVNIGLYDYVYQGKKKYYLGVMEGDIVLPIRFNYRQDFVNPKDVYNFIKENAEVEHVKTDVDEYSVEYVDRDKLLNNLRENLITSRINFNELTDYVVNNAKNGRVYVKPLLQFMNTHTYTNSVDPQAMSSAKEVADMWIREMEKEDTEIQTFTPWTTVIWTILPQVIIIGLTGLIMYLILSSTLPTVEHIVKDTGKLAVTMCSGG